MAAVADVHVIQRRQYDFFPGVRNRDDQFWKLRPRSLDSHDGRLRVFMDRCQQTAILGQLEVRGGLFC